MLVLSRKAGEAIVFPALGITVKVNTIDYGRGRVKLGITAPTDVNVIREELEPFDQVKVSTEVQNGKRD